MKRGTVKFSGVLTLIVGVLSLFCSFFVFGTIFNLSFVTGLTGSGFFATLYSVTYSFFIVPLRNLLSMIPSDILEKILSILLIAFSIFLIVWGIMELVITKRTDEEYAKCKHSCLFPLLLKLFFSIYIILIVFLSFILDGVKTIIEPASDMIGGFQFSAQLIFGVVGILMLLTFILPFTSFSNVAKELLVEGTENTGEEESEQVVEQDAQEYSNNYYNENQPAPLDPSVLIQTNNPEDEFKIIPGQDGVPQNITQRGIDDLVRLERLRKSGAIDEENYAVMRQTIFMNNVKK